MLRFRGFRANFKISTGKGSGLDNFDETPGLSLNGAYRINKDELFGNIELPSPSRQINPSMVTLPVSQSGLSTDTSRSIDNVTKRQNDNGLGRSTPNITANITEQLPKNQTREQKKIEKQRLEKQKKQEKKAAKEKEKAEKLKKGKEKQTAKQASPQPQETPQTKRQPQTVTNPPQPQAVPQMTSQLEDQKQTQQPQNRTQITPQPQVRSQSKPQPQSRKKPAPQPQSTPQLAIRAVRAEYSTNTLESPISRSSGPPPYTPQDNTHDERERSGNITFKADSSWDMINEHRQQLNRPKVKGLPKQTHLDLNYNTGPTAATTDISDA